jgi:peptidoglycan/xylan/chitin deacetylase (PgdA/CDA1 family)
MTPQVTIVMYHYVRELRYTRYPEIKALLLSEFREQLEYLGRHYEFVTIQECMDALNGADLPPNAVLLTFDDGYADHFANVFPLLHERKVQGCFFPPAQAIRKHRVLDVNKIHFILASAPSVDHLLQDVFRCLDDLREEYGIEPKEVLFKRLAQPGRYDTGEVIFIKRLLQRELEREARGRLVDTLFAKYVSVDEAAFSQELYVSMDQLRCMVRCGMHVGSHGHDHYWLDTLPAPEQEREIALSLEFLQEIGSDLDAWVLCYPYGAYNASLVDIAKRRNCRLGLTTRVGVAALTPENALTLERLNTNDIPKQASAPPNQWTQQVQ